MQQNASRPNLTQPTLIDSTTYIQPSISATARATLETFETSVRRTLTELSERDLQPGEKDIEKTSHAFLPMEKEERYIV